MTRLLYTLLGVVAVAAAVLSFAALRDLAIACGFTPGLAWLLPVVVDAGAAAGSLVWLGGAAPETARRFARALALVLLGSSVAANALGHGLAAYRLAPHWTVVVAVSAVAPAVLGAVVHLAVLVGRPDRTTPPDQQTGPDQEQTADPDRPDDVPGLTPQAEVELVERLARKHAGGAELPSNNHLTREHGVGRERAARILRSAADRATWIRKSTAAN